MSLTHNARLVILSAQNITYSHIRSAYVGMFSSKLAKFEQPFRTTLTSSYGQCLLLNSLPQSCHQTQRPVFLNRNSGGSCYHQRKIYSHHFHNQFKPIAHIQSKLSRSIQSQPASKPDTEVESKPNANIESTPDTNAETSAVADPDESDKPEPKENIYTIPNYLTVGRFFISPFLGYMVLQEQFSIACGLFIVTGLTDWLDGYIARNWEGQSSILGSVIDPLADKFLITILAITLTAVHLIPVWLMALVLSRDVYLVFSGFRVRWVTLPPPKTFKRYFDFSHPTASVQPSFISKVNTNVQLLLFTATCAAPVFGYVDHIGLKALWGLTAITTSWSFMSYITKVPYTVLKKK